MGRRATAAHGPSCSALAAVAPSRLTLPSCRDRAWSCQCAKVPSPTSIRSTIRTLVQGRDASPRFQQPDGVVARMLARSWCTLHLALLGYRTRRNSRIHARLCLQVSERGSAPYCVGLETACVGSWWFAIPRMGVRATNGPLQRLGRIEFENAMDFLP
jgi:hypothetical protein